MEKKEVIYEGKAKKVWSTADPSLVVIEFKDEATAFDGTKKATIENKGEINCAMSAILFEYLESFHVPTHFIRRIGPQELLCRRVQIIPVEAVMRNIAAGSLVKRLGFPDGQELKPPIFETYLKNDELHDPMINEFHAQALKVFTPVEFRAMFRLTSRINVILRSFFDRRNLLLVDFKLEFGRFENTLILADEISPDTCRIWDKHTHKKLDKDRFRFDLGDVESAYNEVLRRIS
ncbi:MAG: phosphoribosylaminoimidazolesuccinocarboxamide synthase [bacterium]